MKHFLHDRPIIFYIREGGFNDGGEETAKIATRIMAIIASAPPLRSIIAMITQLTISLEGSCTEIVGTVAPKYQKKIGTTSKPMYILFGYMDP